MVVQGRLVSEELRHVSVIVPSSSLDNVVTKVLKMGVLHPEELRESNVGEPSLKARRVLFEVREKIGRLESYMKNLNLPLPDIEEVSASFEEAGVESWEKLAEEIFKESKPLEEEVERQNREYQELMQRLKDLMEKREFLSKISFIDFDVDEVRRLHRFYVFLSLAPKEAVNGVVKSVTKYPEIIVISKEVSDEESVLMIVAPSKIYHIAASILENFKIRSLELPEGIPRIPKKAMEEVENIIESVEKKKEELLEKAKNMLPQVHKTYLSLLTLRDAFRIIAGARYTRFFTYFEGYIPKRSVNEFIKTVREASGNSAMIMVRGEIRGVKEEIPTYVKLPWYLKPFHMVTEIYSTPGPRELVPTVIMAITFPIIYGLMFPDAGHALLLLLVGYYLYKNAAGSSGRKDMGLLLLYVGVSSLIAGMLAGEFFGPLLSGYLDFSKLFGGRLPYASPTHPLAAEADKLLKGEATPHMEEINYLLFNMLLLSFRIGGIVLVLGTLMGVINGLLEYEYRETLLVRLPKFLLFFFVAMPFYVASGWGIEPLTEAGHILYEATMGPAIMPIARIVRYGSIIAILWMWFGEPLYTAVREGAKRGLSKIGNSFMELFDTILMVIGNTASFLRIMGLALAHSGLMFGFTILTVMVWHNGVLGIIGGVLIYIAGNLLTAGLEGIIVFAHTLRLHFYEWFSKFFVGGGIPYLPARIWLMPALSSV